MKTTKWQLWGRGLICLMALAAAIFYWDTLCEILGGIRQISAVGFCVSILLSAAAYVVEGMTISLMAGAVIPRLPVQRGIAIALICEFYRMITLGNGPGIVEIHYLHKDGMEPGSATVVTMIQYMVKRTAVMLLGVLGFVVLYSGGNGKEICSKYAAFMGTGCLITIGVIACFMGLTLSSKIAAWAGTFLDWLCRKLPSWEKRFLQWKQQIDLLNHSGKEIVKQKYRLFGTVLLQTGKMLLFYAIPVCLLYEKTGLSFAENILLMAVAYMLAGVIPAPSGIGALEFVFLLFFTGFVETGAALPAILLFRFVTWVLPFGVGGGVLIWMRTRGY
ncbi:MAG: flippase-like domain-containing protein [Ruminococcus sp.]|nr:flippase-like domain-containing protein [Ruminococcus sp.]